MMKLQYSQLATATFLTLLLLAAHSSELLAAPEPAQNFGAETIDDDPTAAPVPSTPNQPSITASPSSEADTEDSAASDSDKQSGKATGSIPSSDREDKDITAVLNVKDVELAALVKSFSRLTKRNYIVDSSVKGKVTVHLATPVSIPDALRILDSVLLLKGFAAVPVGPNTWKIIPAKEAKQTTIPTTSGDLDRPTDALVTQLIRLRHVKASELQQTLSQFVSKDGVVTAASSTNALIVIDSAANIDRLAELTRDLDVPALDQDITIIPIKHAEARDLAEKLNQLLGNNEEDSSTTALRVPRPTFNRSVATQLSNVNANRGRNQPAIDERRALPAKIIADERTNSVVVVADPETTLKVRALAAQLDSEVDRSGGRFWVYRLKHADAETLANVLGAVISGSGDTSGGSSQGTTGSSLTRSLSSSRSGFGGDSGLSSRSSRGRMSRSSSADRSIGGSGTTGGQVVSVSGKVNFEGEVSVAADSATNSLIVNASRTDYSRLKEVIDQLDIKRRQVLVESTILEVSLSRDRGLGVEFQSSGGGNSGGAVAQTNWGGLTSLLTNPAQLNDLTIAAASSGTLTLPGGLTIPSQALLISAVSANQNVNVLSSPTILTTDNHEAEIIVGENVPFVTSTSSNETNLNNTFNQIERQDVGITLRITPQIGTASWVTLRMFVEISNVVPTTRNDPNGPTTSVRTTETSVEVKSGQMIVTGGLISDNSSESTRGVPFWEDIPVLGNLFHREDSNRRRTNLLIFITPRVVDDQYSARDITKEQAGDMDRVMQQYQSEPSRQNILRSEAMDRVTERGEENLPDTSTIIPPTSYERARSLTGEEAAALARTEKAISSLAATSVEPGTGRKSEQNSGAINLTVTPKLPAADSTANVSDATTEAARTEQASKTYVVLRNVHDGEPQTVGIILSAEPESDGAKFFEIGRRYRKTQGKFSGDYLCLGKFESIAELGRVHPEMAEGATWQTLSPQELLQLGRAIWFRGA